MDTVRTVEQAIAADRRGEDVPEELDIASLGSITEEEWRAHLAVASREPCAETEAGTGPHSRAEACRRARTGPGRGARAVTG